jgi:hypothetical protein
MSQTGMKIDIDDGRATEPAEERDPGGLTYF